MNLQVVDMGKIFKPLDGYIRVRLALFQIDPLIGQCWCVCFQVQRFEGCHACRCQSGISKIIYRGALRESGPVYYRGKTDIWRWKQYPEFEISIMGYCPISRDSEPIKLSHFRRFTCSILIYIIYIIIIIIIHFIYNALYIQESQSAFFLLLYYLYICGNIILLTYSFVCCCFFANGCMDWQLLISIHW